jgi:hypothetical protein
MRWFWEPAYWQQPAALDGSEWIAGVKIPETAQGKKAKN